MPDQKSSRKPPSKSDDATPRESVDDDPTPVSPFPVLADPSAPTSAPTPAAAAPPARAPAAPRSHPATVTNDGLTPMVVHVSGTHWSNNLVELYRAAPSGDLADRWMVRKGSILVMADGKNTIPAARYHEIRPSLQPKVTMTFEQAMKIARG